MLSLCLFSPTVPIGFLSTASIIVAVAGATLVATGIMIAIVKRIAQAKHDSASVNGPIHIRLPVNHRATNKEEDFYFEAATEKQIAFIKQLGGTPDPYISKSDASALINSLQDSIPPTTAQVRMIKSLCSTAEIPKSKTQASALIQQLKMTVPALKRQHTKALELGIVLHEKSTYQQAEELISDAENDNDPEDGKPPTKHQTNKIIRLGGDPAKVKNRWRAETYISDLEDKLDQKKDEKEQWVDYVLEWYFDPNDDFKIFDIKKPSKKILKKVYDYAKAQGFEAEWESDPLTFERVLLSVVASEQKRAVSGH